MLLWYLHSTDNASRAATPQRRRVPLGEPPEPLRPMEFEHRLAGLDWCDAELTNLAAAVRQAGALGEYDIAWKLPIAMREFFRARLRSAERVDLIGIGRRAEARGALRDALRILEGIGDARAEAVRALLAEPD